MAVFLLSQSRPGVDSHELAHNKIGKIIVGVKIKIKESKVDINNNSFVYIDSIQKIDKAVEKKS